MYTSPLSIRRMPLGNTLTARTKFGKQDRLVLRNLEEKRDRAMCRVTLEAASLMFQQDKVDDYMRIKHIPHGNSSMRHLVTWIQAGDNTSKRIPRDSIFQREASNAHERDGWHLNMAFQ